MAEFLQKENSSNQKDKKEKKDTNEKFALDRVTNLRHTIPTNIYRIHTTIHH